MAHTHTYTHIHTHTHAYTRIHTHTHKHNGLTINKEREREREREREMFPTCEPTYFVILKEGREKKLLKIDKTKKDVPKHIRAKSSCVKNALGKKAIQHVKIGRL